MRAKHVAWIALSLLLLLGAGTWWWLSRDESQRDDGYRFEQGPDVARQLREIAGRGPAAEPPAQPEAPDSTPPLDAPVAGPPTTLEFSLEDTEGDPVAGAPARLWLLPGTLEGGAYWPRMAALQASGVLPTDEPPISTVSDAAGQLRFENVPASRRVYVEVPPHEGFGAEALFDATRWPRRKVIRLVASDGPLTLQVVGLPPHAGTACAILRWPRLAEGMGALVTMRHASCVVPLDETGAGVTPALRGGRLQADIFLPGYGLICNLPVYRLGGGAAEVHLPEVPTTTVRGRLVGPDGEAVPRAEVALSVTAYLASPDQAQWCLFGHVAADGTFAFERVPVGTIDELFIDPADNVAPRLVLEHAPLRPDDDVDVHVQLVPGASVVGRVVDARGAPVAGASVFPNQHGGGMSFWSPAATWTDEDGRWRIDNLLPGTCKVGITSPATNAKLELEPTLLTGVVTRTPLGRMPEVAAGGRVEVQVVAADGQPVSGASVSYNVKQERSSGVVHTGPTDADGRYVIESIQTDFTSFGVWASKRGASTAAQEVAREEAAARTALVRLVLPDVGSIRGRVLSGGEPAPGVSVVAGESGKEGLTTESGDYRIWAVPPGEWQVSLRAPSGTSVGEPVTVVVKAGEVTRLDLAFEPSDSDTRLRGRLLRPDGQGWAGVWLDAKPMDADSRRWEGSGRWVPRGKTVTDDDGRFELRVARPGLYRILSGRRELRADVTAPDESLELRFDPASVQLVQGRLLDTDGNPLLGGEIALHREGGGREHQVHGGGGCFRLELLPGPASDFLLDVIGGLVSARGAEVRHDHTPVPFKANETVTLRPTILEEPEAPVPALAGIVVADDGTPVPGATLWRVKGDGMSGITRSGADGTFTVVGRPPLDEGVDLAVTAPAGFRERSRPRYIRFADGPLRIVVPRMTAAESFTATIDVMDRDGMPVPGILLELQSVDSRAARTNEAGRAVFEALRRQSWTVTPAGRFTDTVEGYLGELGFESVDVSPEQPHARLEVPLRKRNPSQEQDLVVRLVDPAGGFLEGAVAQVKLIGLEDHEGEKHSSDDAHRWKRATTRFRFAHVPYGRYRVELTWEGLDAPYLDVEPFEVRVPRGEIEVSLRRAAVLHGRVAGESSADGLVSFHDPKRGWWLYRPLAEGGAFAVNVDPDIHFTVYVRRDDSDAYGLVEGLKASDSPVEIHLDKPGRTLRGRVHGLQRMPDRYELRAKGPLPHPLPLAMNEQGQFELKGAPPGTYEVWFETWDEGAFDGKDEMDPFRASATSEKEEPIDLHPKRVR